MRYFLILIILVIIFLAAWYAPCIKCGGCRKHNKRCSCICGCCGHEGCK